MSAINIILLISLVIIAFVFGKALSKSLLHPVRIFSIMWICILAVTLIGWKNNYIWNLNGLVWILCAIIAYEIGALVVGNRNKEAHIVREYAFDWRILVVVVALGWMGFLLQLNAAGFHIADFFSIKNILNMNRQVAHQRYSAGGQQTNVIVQLFLPFIYLSTVCGGYSFNFAKTKIEKNLTTIGAFFPIVASMLFSNTKSGFVSCVVLWFAGWCISYLLINGELPKINLKYLLGLAGGFFIIIMILYFVMLLRLGEFSKKMQDVVAQKLLVYALGSVVNFDYWFSLGTQFHDYTFGMNTFMSIFNTLGISTRIQGVYEVLIPEYGNVFTAFRALILDFGVFGALVFCFISGMLTQWCYNRVSSGKMQTAIAGTILLCMYFWNIFGLFTSPWAYMSYVLMVAEFCAFLVLVHKRIRIKRKNI